jgi:UDP-2,3-diacylglucosamine pyrophosphatase LpxH
LRSFSALPNPVADLLDDQLNKSNNVKRMKDEAKLLPYYHRYADTLDSDTDLVIFGHIHTPIHDVGRSPNLIVLGSWHDKTHYLRLDEAGLRMIAEDDPAELT